MQAYMPRRGFRPPPQRHLSTYVCNFSEIPNSMYGSSGYFDQNLYLPWPLHPRSNANMHHNSYWESLPQVNNTNIQGPMGYFYDTWSFPRAPINMHHPNTYMGNFLQEPLGPYNHHHPFMQRPHAWQPQPHFNPAPVNINWSNFYGPPPMHSVPWASPGPVRSLSHYATQPAAPVSDLATRIVKQIEYYFSDTNLPEDYYLLSLMDEQGWVPISAVAEFNRVKRMTRDIFFILHALHWSSSIEVQGNKIRRRESWPKWVDYHRSRASLLKVQTPQGQVQEETDVLICSTDEASAKNILCSQTGGSDCSVSVNQSVSVEENREKILSNDEQTEEKGSEDSTQISETGLEIRLSNFDRILSCVTDSELKSSGGDSSMGSQSLHCF